VLLVEFPRVVVVPDEVFEVTDVLLFLPSASLHIPVQPLDQIILFAVLLFHVQNLFHLVVLLLIALLFAFL
jgi:hypothetical protein